MRNRVEDSQRAVLNGMIKSLREIGNLNEGAFSMEMQRRANKGRGPSGAGKALLVIAAGVMAILNGIRGSTSGAVTWGAIAYFMANPGILKPKEQNVVNETGASVYNPTFLRLASDYGIEGEEWRDIAKEIMDGKAGLTTFMRNRASYRPSENQSPIPIIPGIMPKYKDELKDGVNKNELRENLFTNLTGEEVPKNDNEIKQLKKKPVSSALYSMIIKKPKQIFQLVDALKKAKSRDAKTSALHVIEKGLWRQAT